MPEEAWIRVSAGEGSKGERLDDLACVPLTSADVDEVGFRAGHWLLVRRQIDDPRELAYYLCYGPSQTEVRQLIRIAGKRWSIEDGFRAAKGEAGLDEYEVRKWDGWYRHITLSLLAHAYLAVLRSAAETAEGSAKGGALQSDLCPELIPPTVPEVRRLVLAMTESEQEREFRLGWSLFRRAHQAVAERCHKAKHAARRNSPPEVPPESGEAVAATVAVPPRGGGAVLTDAEWERVSPLLPAQKPPRGRPRRDQRQVLSGMLWIMYSGASWRDLPEE